MRRPRSLRRVLAIAPTVAASWVMLVGLPLAPSTGRPGHLETSTVTLSGPAAEAVPRASDTTGGSSSLRRTTGAATDGWSAGVDLTAGTQMVALSWADRPEAGVPTVEVRSRHDDTWTAWSPQTADPDAGPDVSSGRAGIGPVWLGSAGADRVELRVANGTLSDLRLMRMRWVEPTGGSAGRADAEPAGPAIHPRSDWTRGGWRSDNPGCSKQPVRMEQLKFAVVHHTVNSNDYSAAQVPGLIAGTYEYHTASLGWCDIAYNFVIDRFGGVWQGRSGDATTPIQGGHAKGFNTDSVGVVLLGQFEPGSSPAAAKPSAAMVYALENLLAWKLSIHGIGPTGTVSVVSQGSTSIKSGTRITIPTIVGHRDIAATDCPGAYVYSLLSAIRSDVAAITERASTPAAWAPFSNPRAIGARQYLDFYGRAATNTDQAVWASKLQRAKRTPAGLITDVLDGPEFQERTAPAVRLYLAYFGRMPDHTGLTYWLGRLRSSPGALASMSSSFAASSEFQRTYGTLTDTQFVDRVYRNVLGRTPDSSGGDFWRAQLRTGARSRGALMIGFSESSEYRRKTVPSVDIVIVYEAMLRRSPSVTSYVSWLKKLADGTPVIDLVRAAYDGSEYVARIRG